MSGVYSHNKLFDSFNWVGVEDLPALEDDTHTSDSLETSVFEDYETSMEDGWPDFIKDIYA